MTEGSGAGLEREFFGPPEGSDLVPGSFVVRPSLWAGLEAAVQVLLAMLPILVPVVVSLSLSGRLDFAREGPVLLALLDHIELGIGFLVAFAPVVRLAFTRYSFDDEGIRVRTQLLAKVDHRVPWEKVTAVRHRRTLADRAFGLAHLDVVAYGARGTVVRLVGLRDGAALRDLVGRRMRETASVASLLRSD